MQLRTFRGREMSLIFEHIRSELGEDAVVVASRQDENRFFEVDVYQPQISTSDVLEIGPGRGYHSKISQKVDLHLSSAEEQVGVAKTLDVPLGKILAGKGCGQDFISTLVTASAHRPGPEGLVAALDSSLHFEPLFHPDTRILVTLGPTGSGKTSTAIKLALRCAHELLESVVILAVPAAESHGWDPRGAILEDAGIPIVILEDYKHLGDRITEQSLRLSGVDKIIIDLPGCSPFDGHTIGWMRRELLKVPWVERLLCVAAGTNEPDAMAWMRRFDLGGPSRVIITKLDESLYIGPLCTALYRSRKPISFFSSGQAIPTDLEPASARRLAWFLSRS